MDLHLVKNWERYRADARRRRADNNNPCRNCHPGCHMNPYLVQHIISTDTAAIERAPIRIAQPCWGQQKYAYKEVLRVLWPQPFTQLNPKTHPSFMDSFTLTPTVVDMPSDAEQSGPGTNLYCVVAWAGDSMRIAHHSTQYSFTHLWCDWLPIFTESLSCSLDFFSLTDTHQQIWHSVSSNF